MRQYSQKGSKETGYFEVGLFLRTVGVKLGRAAGAGGLVAGILAGGDSWVLPYPVPTSSPYIPS